MTYFLYDLTTGEFMGVTVTPNDHPNLGNTLVSVPVYDEYDQYLTWNGQTWEIHNAG